MLKNLFGSPVVDEGQEKVNMYDPEGHEDKVKPILVGNFETIQHEDNPTRFMEKGFDLPSEKRRRKYQENAKSTVNIVEKLVDANSIPK